MRDCNSATEPFRVLDLFSGIGGFSLGLEATGLFETVAFCEIEPFPTALLRKRWPSVPVYPDVRGLTYGQLKRDGLLPIDALCGGFPCQDISTAGKGAGLAGERSGLWSEIVRLVGEIRPRYVLVENVAALLFRGRGGVLGDLAALGYDAEWHCIPASAFGASHRRDRIWILAYSNAMRWEQAGELEKLARSERADGCQLSGASVGGQLLPDAHRLGREDGAERYPALPILGRFGAPAGSMWPAEPGMGRVADGIPDQVDRLEGLGNAVAPPVVEWIAR